MKYLLLAMGWELARVAEDVQDLTYTGSEYASSMWLIEYPLCCRKQTSASESTMVMTATEAGFLVTEEDFDRYMWVRHAAFILHDMIRKQWSVLCVFSSHHIPIKRSVWGNIYCCSIVLYLMTRLDKMYAGIFLCVRSALCKKSWQMSAWWVKTQVEVGDNYCLMDDEKPVAACSWVYHAVAASVVCPKT